MGNALQNLWCVNQVKGRASHRTSEGITTVRAAMGAHFKNLRHLRCCQRGTDRKSTTQGFCGCHNVRLHIVPLVGIQLAGSTYSCLNLIQYH